MENLDNEGLKLEQSRASLKSYLQIKNNERKRSSKQFYIVGALMFLVILGLIFFVPMGAFYLLILLVALAMLAYLFATNFDSLHKDLENEVFTDLEIQHLKDNVDTYTFNRILEHAIKYNKSNVTLGFIYNFNGLLDDEINLLSRKASLESYLV